MTADMGFTAGKKFSQTLEGAADVSYLSAFTEVLDVAKAAQEAERVLLAQQQEAAGGISRQQEASAGSNSSQATKGLDTARSRSPLW